MMQRGNRKLLLYKGNSEINFDASEFYSIWYKKNIILFKLFRNRVLKHIL